MAKLINCKECGKEISKSAKVCPHCGKKQKKSLLVKLLAIVALLIGLGWAFSDAGDAVGKTGSSSSAKDYKIGEVFTGSGFEIKITKVEKKDVLGRDLFRSTPADGGTYVGVQYETKNVTDKPISSFSIPSINLIDAKGTEYSPDMSASGAYATEFENDSKILSDLNPGIKVKNSSAFEISKEAIKQEGWKVKIGKATVPFTVK